MFKKRKEEVFVTQDIGLFCNAQNALRESNMDYKIKTVNSGSQNRRTGSVIGSFGENKNFQIMYYIYVAPEEAERARYVINEHRKNNR